MLVIVHARVIVARKCHLGLLGPSVCRRRMIRWVYVLTDQSLLMAPIDQILAGLASLWDSLASPMTEIGTEVY